MIKMSKFVFLFTFTVSMLLIFNSKVFADHVTDYLNSIGYNPNNNSWNPTISFVNCDETKRKDRMDKLYFVVFGNQDKSKFTIADLTKRIGDKGIRKLKREYTRLYLIGLGYDQLTNKWDPVFNLDNFERDNNIPFDKRLGANPYHFTGPKGALFEKRFNDLIHLLYPEIKEMMPWIDKYEIKDLRIECEHINLLTVGYDILTDQWKPVFNIKNYQITWQRSGPYFDFKTDWSEIDYRTHSIGGYIRYMHEEHGEDKKTIIGYKDMQKLKKEYLHLYLFDIGYDLLTNQWNPPLSPENYDARLANDRITKLDYLFKNSQDKNPTEYFSSRELLNWLGKDGRKKLRSGYNFFRKIVPKK